VAAAELNVVTGALGFTGRYIAQALLERGSRVRTLTGHPALPNPFGDQIEIAPLDFNSSGDLAKNLEGAAVLFNTYWIRFPYDGATFDTAVTNTRTLVRAAQLAGVRRIIHISITGAAADSRLPYFRGKGLAEQAVAESKLSYMIIRPTLVFGAGDILINNIAWLLRRFPFFMLPGWGDYRVQPVFVGDIAALAVTGASESANRTVDAAGPEIFTFSNLVRTVAHAAGRRALIVPGPPGLALRLSTLVGWAVKDVMLTRDEVDGLMAGLLVSHGAPTCPTALSRWLGENAGRIGETYASELARRHIGR
jgi:uncharacterized protein YbjT (DUF2867 family)